HDVLEEMGESRATALFVPTTHQVPNVRRDGRDGVVLVNDEGQAVRQRINADGDPKSCRRNGLGGTPSGDRPEEREGQSQTGDPDGSSYAGSGCGGKESHTKFDTPVAAVGSRWTKPGSGGREALPCGSVRSQFRSPASQSAAVQRYEQGWLRPTDPA